MFEFVLGYRLPLYIKTNFATGITAIDDAHCVLAYMKRTRGVPLSRLHDVSPQSENNMTKTSANDDIADGMMKAMEKKWPRRVARFLRK